MLRREERCIWGHFEGWRLTLNSPPCTRGPIQRLAPPFFPPGGAELGVRVRGCSARIAIFLIAAYAGTARDTGLKHPSSGTHGVAETARLTLNAWASAIRPRPKSCASLKAVGLIPCVWPSECPPACTAPTHRPVQWSARPALAKSPIAQSSQFAQATNFSGRVWKALAGGRLCR